MNTDKPQQEAFDVDTFHPSDAEGVADLFRSVYGEGYPVKTVYQPQALIEAFRTKENIPIVARTRSGRIIAYEALYRSTPNPDLYEAGQGLVRPEYRGLGINSEINHYLTDTVIPRLDIEAVFGEAVCNHIHMQKEWAKYTVETAIEVDLMPAEAYAAEASATGRVATVLGFLTYRPRKQVIYLPARYQTQLEFIYSVLPAEYEFKPSEDGLPSYASTIDLQVFDFAKVARLTLRQWGSDLVAMLERHESTLASRGIVVLQAWLPLSEASVGVAVDILYQQNYFFGGLLPRWFGNDGLLMQKVLQRPNWEGVHLYSDRAQKLLSLIRDDWSQTVKL